MLLIQIDEKNVKTLQLKNEYFRYIFICMNQNKFISFKTKTHKIGIKIIP